MRKYSKTELLKRELSNTYDVMLSLLEDNEEARRKLEQYSRDLEKRVEERTFEISVLYELSKKISFTLSFDELVKLILESLQEVTHYTVAGTILCHEGLDRVIIREAQPIGDNLIREFREILIEGFHCLTGKGDRKNTVTEIELEQGDHYDGSLKPLEGGIRSFFNVPLISEDEVVGMIGISSTEERAFDEDHIRILYTIASQATESINRLRGLLSSQKSRIESMVESMGDGVIMFDEMERPVIINPAARRFFEIEDGGSPTLHALNQLLGFNPMALMREEKEDSLRRDVNLLNRCYQANLSKMRAENGDVTGVVMTLRDMTREKELDRIKTEMISVVSHELRSPLTSIKNAVAIIFGGKAGELTEHQRSFLSMAQRNIHRLNNIIERHLTLSRLETGRLAIRMEAFDLGKSIDGIIDSFMEKAKAKSIELRRNIPGSLPKAYGDLEKVEQILTNLVDNAIKFTPGGGEVHISAKPMDSWVEVMISDTGIGIPQEALNAIFEKYWQVENSLTKETEGTGLGLAITQGLVRAHGGRIWAESEKGRGSRFRFTLPTEEGGRVDSELQAGERISP